MKGDGKGPSAVFLNPKPRDFTTGLFKFRSTVGKDSLPRDADLYVTLTHGLWGTSMPSWQEISDRQRWAVVHYLKTFSDRWGKEPARQPVSVPSEASVTPTSIKNGQELFQVNCALCHGERGKADGPLGEPGLLTDDWGAPIKPAHLSLPAGVVGGVKLGYDGVRLYQTIMTGVGGTPMPPFDTMRSEEVWDLVHYVQSLRVEAHEEELMAVGLKEEDRASVRQRIWASMSHRAEVRKTKTTGGPGPVAASGLAMREPPREP